MPNLKCYKYSCVNNHCSHCKLDDISVSKDAMCEDYQKRMNMNDQKCDFEFAYEKSMSLKQDECQIKCEAYACMHNTSGDCNANYIRMDECGDKAKCCQAKVE